MKDPHAPPSLPPGRDAGVVDRVLAGGIAFTFLVAVFAYAPMAPFPLALQRHAAGVAAGALLLMLGVLAAAGRGFPIPPIPAATVSLAAAFFASPLLASVFRFGHSPGRAASAATAAGVLVLFSAAARSVARAHLGTALLTIVGAAGAAIGLLGLAEAAGLDPLRTAGFYDSQRNPVATFGNPDAVADFVAPAASLAIALGASRGGVPRILLLIAGSIGAAYTGVLGVLYGLASLGAGFVAGAACTMLRVRRGGGNLRDIARPLALQWCIPAALCCLGFFASPLRSDAPPASAPVATAAAPAETWHLPPTLEVRLRIWNRCIDTVRSFAPWGTLAGNFSIGFARFRDPVEIQISTQNRRDDAESIVNVAHNDFIQLIVELGVLGAVVLILFARGLLRWRKGQLFSATPNTVAASAALASLAVAACFHSPFYEHAAAALLGFACLGIVGAADGSQPESLTGPSSRAAGIAVILCIPWLMWIAGAPLYCDILMSAERLHPLGGAGRLQRALELDRDDERIALALARRLQSENDTAGALRAYGEAIARHPFLVEALLQSGVILARSGEWKAANIAFEECAKVDPGHPGLAYNRAVLAREAGDDGRAASILLESRRLGVDPRHLRDWGFLFLENKKYDRAIPYLDRWTQWNERDADAYSKLGECFLKLNNRAAAELDFARAHRIYALDHLRDGKLAAAERSNRQYQKWSSQTDAGPDVLDAAIALARRDRNAALLALRRAAEAGRTLDRKFADEPSFTELSRDPELGSALTGLLPK